MLYPIITCSRNVYTLDGIWKFKLDGENLSESWAKQTLTETQNICVPASFNDQNEGENFRDHFGWIWYERELELPHFVLTNERIVIRFDAATHNAKVYINGKFVVSHRGGFTPFEAEINEFLVTGVNRVSVAVDTVVDNTTIPLGGIKDYSTPEYGAKKYNAPNFDFFNYTGLNRSVRIYTTPKKHIQDIEIVTEVENNTAQVSFKVITSESGTVKVSIVDEKGQVIGESSESEGIITIQSPTLWEPLNAYLYQLKVEFYDDCYTEEFGIRTVKVENGQFLINDKPFYFKGFGKHEDAHVNGRGLNPVMYVKDINLMKWMGANSFRTSHYPYSEEFLRLADREGIVVINECAAVGLNFDLAAFFGIFEPGSQTWDTIGTHKDHEMAMRELIKRDKNHPCVVMWSVANEAAEQTEGALEYFQPIIELTRKLDPQKRPITSVSQGKSIPSTNRIAHLVDVICLNRYFGWYSESGFLNKAESELRKELKDWEAKYPEKPIVFTEYGADTVAGMHDVTPVMFTEEYQRDYIQMNSKVFDEFKNVVGEQIWNFADFATVQGIVRVQGNKKGIFTRDRKPKLVAHWLKDRWTSIADFHNKK